jgi:hypothetical protein
MNKASIRRIYLIGMSIILVLTWSVLAGACKKEAEEPEPKPEVQTATGEATTAPITKAMITDVFGEAGPDASGVYSLEKEGGEINLTYHYIYESDKGMDEQIGEDLMPKLQRFFEKHEHIKELGFVIYTSPMDEDAELKPYVSFTVNHVTFDDVEWADFPAADLFKIVDNLHYL